MPKSQRRAPKPQESGARGCPLPWARQRLGAPTDGQGEKLLMDQLCLALKTPTYRHKTPTLNIYPCFGAITWALRQLSTSPSPDAPEEEACFPGASFQRRSSLLLFLSTRLFSLSQLSAREGMDHILLLSTHHYLEALPWRRLPPGWTLGPAMVAGREGSSLQSGANK